MKAQTTIKQKRSRLDLGPYAGKWVALVKREVRATAQNLPALMRELKARKIERQSSVMLVPRKDEGPYILLVSEQ